MELDLEEAVNGVEREIRVPTLVGCHHCNSSGSADGKTGTCKTCAGHGRVRMQNGIFSIQQTCPTCGGAGRAVTNPCTHCHGAGRLEEEKLVRVKVPAGVDQGDRIRLSGEGEAGPAGSSAGDLYVEMAVREHPIFKREGDDLYCEIPIRVTTASLGGEMKIPTLDGSAVLKIPDGTQTGKIFRLRGKGVQSVRSHSKGDLLCRVVVETPVKLTAEQRELLEQLETSFTGESSEHSPRSSSWLDSVKDFFGRIGA
jgi:molecular chaperone DnaJ